MSILESITVALTSLWSNKMRSFLTMLGIIIGISSVITIVALGEGSKKQIGKEFEKIGSNSVSLRLNWSNNPLYKDRYNDKDIEAIRKSYGDVIKGVSPFQYINGKAVNGREDNNIYAIGVSEDYNKIQDIQLIHGRFLLTSDIKSQRDAIVIDEDVALKLFRRSDVVGEKLLVDTGWTKHSYVIVGVFKYIESTFDKMNMGERVPYCYIPYSVITKLGYGSNFSTLAINFIQGIDQNKYSNEIVKLVERIHRNVGKDFYMVESSEQAMNMLNSIMGTLSAVLGAIAAISLLVGGIGVMNIMLVSVTERTREIGIRKAIGARRRDILSQFLVESMIISGIGGIIGTVFGYLVAGIVFMKLDIPPAVSVTTVLIAVSFSAAVGITFGLYPANKAAKLDPIDALRYE
ncbi:ABC transporter permease [Abyssisolibacter fermentans]|uniref:ABC transporter permease n=1 Tax=Abyssisolibacter fermentans TaxID=1766203 RepID=UPI000833A2D6|nr:ABC transporter permease [Abyssisolibacter fermentans]